MNALIFIIIGVILAIVELLVMDFTFIFFSAGFFITGLLSFGFHLAVSYTHLTLPTNREV